MRVQNHFSRTAVPRCPSVILIEWNRFFDDIDLVISNYHNLSINFSFGEVICMHMYM